MLTRCHTCGGKSEHRQWCAETNSVALGSWIAQAACAGHSMEPNGVDQTIAAKARCHGCPVKRECLAFALGEGPGESVGQIWGGATPHELKDLRRRIRINGEQEITEHFRKLRDRVAAIS